MAKASLSCRWPVVFRADPTDPSPQQERQGSQNLAQELPGPRVLCLFEKRRRRAVLDDDAAVGEVDVVGDLAGEAHLVGDQDARSEEHTSELQSLMRISYAVFCLKKKKKR